MRYNRPMTLLRLPLMAMLAAGALLTIADANAASRAMPTSSAELWGRWLDFLGAGGGEVSQNRFEEVFGLELSKVQRLSDEASRQTLRIERAEGRFLLAAVDSYPKENSYSLVALQWTSHFFEDGQCLDIATLTADLARLGWTPSLRPTPVGATFRKGYAEMAYSHHWAPHFQYCGLSLRPHRFGIERLDRVRLEGR
jgi:hypothetical protein